MIFRRRAEPEAALDPDVREWLTQEVEIPPEFYGATSPGTQPRYEALRCQWCQGVHFRACPRVRELEYHENGGVRRVRFWPEGEFDDSDVIWPEAIFVDE